MAAAPCPTCRWQVVWQNGKRRHRWAMQPLPAIPDESTLPNLAWLITPHLFSGCSASGWRQTCLVHLLHKLEHMERYKLPGKHWPAFAKKLRCLLGDAVQLWPGCDELPEGTSTSRRGGARGGGRWPSPKPRSVNAYGPFSGRRAGDRRENCRARARRRSCGWSARSRIPRGGSERDSHREPRSKHGGHRRAADLPSRR